MTSASNFKILRINSLMLIVLLPCSFIYGKIIYVDDNAAGANNGSSWTYAYPCLQNALMFAQQGDEIRVAQGIYKPDREIQPEPDGTVAASGDRRATFQLINGVDIKGGYAGLSGPDPNERDISLYETILSGDLNDDDNDVNDPCDLLTEPTRAENCYVVVTGYNVDCLLEGLIISSGNANGPIENPSLPGSGGGMRLPLSPVTITNCIFRNNSAIGGGGAISSSGESPTLNNCMFIWNSGGYIPKRGSGPPILGGGGGMYNQGNSPILTNCTFIENHAPMGGGIYNSGVMMYKNNCSPTLTNCTFSGNRAEMSGGGIFSMDCNAMLTDCIFTANSAQSSGGAIGNMQSNLTLTNCTFRENFTDGSGGGMYNVKADAMLTNCTFSRNLADNNGGGINNGSDSKPTLTNCMFRGNKAEKDGGGLYNSNSNPTLINCAFSGNTAANWGGGINNSNSIVGITNCTFTGNSAEIGNALACDSLNQQSPSILELINCIVWDGDNKIWNNDDSIIFIEYGNVQGGWSGEGGDNIDADPLFVDADGVDNVIGTEDDDLRLLPDSPCIDIGDNSAIPESVETDAGGNPRIVNNTVDIGAYEFSMEAEPDEIKYGGGTGEPNDPYLIYTAEQLNTIGLNKEDSDKNFKLMADIDLSAYQGDSFNRIGVYEPPDYFPSWRPPFTGVFDGNGHTISNFTYVVDVNEPLKENGHYGEECVGLFGVVSGTQAQIKNLGLIDPNIYPAATCTERVSAVGAIAGRLSDGSITNCYVEGGRISADITVGGLVGSNLEGTISNCSTTCNVTLAKDRWLRPLDEPFGSIGFSFGGLVGYSRGWIYNCDATGIIQGAGSTGGLVGFNDCDILNPEFEIGVISESYATGNVSGNKNIGGLAGENSGRIHLCYALGNVSGTNQAGGLVGNMIIDEGSISDSYATGDVSGNEQIGGLVGYSNGLTQDSCATGNVSGTVYVGGLIGFNGSGTIYHSYASGAVFGSENVGALVGRNGAGTIYCCYAKGDVLGTTYVGGLAGTNFSTIRCCYAANAVSGIQSVGGLVGDNWSSGATIITSLWDIETSGLTDMCGIQSSGASGCDNIYGKTPAEMQTAGTFLRGYWDFVDETENGTEDIWWINEGQDYPRLWWETQ